MKKSKRYFLLVMSMLVLGSILGTDAQANLSCRTDKDGHPTECKECGDNSDCSIEYDY